VLCIDILLSEEESKIKIIELPQSSSDFVSFAF